MAGQRVTNSDGELVNWARGIMSQVEDDTFEELERSVADGALYARGFIATRGTRESGKQGRIDEGTMIQAIDHRVDRLANGRARGFFGWLGGWNTPENKYFVYQEGGFWHVNAGRQIEGMFAIADAAEAAFEEMKGRIAAKLAAAKPRMPTKRVTLLRMKK